MAFSPDIKRKIIADNLHMQEREISALLDARRSHLSDLASMLLLPHRNMTVTAAHIRAMGEDALLTGGEIAIHREARVDIRDSLISAMAPVAAYDRAVLSTMIFSHLARAGQTMTQADFLSVSNRMPRIAYVRNAYTEEAFDAFSTMYDSVTASFTDSYEDACREVAEGSAGFCILPWRDTSRAYHRPTLTMLEVFDLLAISQVTVTDGEDVPMQYVLVSRTPCLPQEAWEMLIALPTEWQGRQGELAVTFSQLGITLAGISHVPDTKGMLCTLRGNGDPAVLFIWLHLFSPSYHLRGYYPITEENTI